jgi:hypothetical protein
MTMTTLDREKQYIRKWRVKAARGDCSAMSNVAAAYRILENFRLAARWYKRAAEHGDGDALTEWGYCLQHGIGTRKDERAAEQSYRAAIASKGITDYAREEAMYHLAVLLLCRQSASSRRAAANLLRAANVDEDYPQSGGPSPHDQISRRTERLHLSPRTEATPRQKTLPFAHENGKAEDLRCWRPAAE